MHDDDFERDGNLVTPTMRGNANLDVQDYQGPLRSSILDDELQEDVRSTPGSGAASAPDIDGTSDWEFAPEADMSRPGMHQSDYGSSPWGPGSGAGYRPYSMQTTDMGAGMGAAEPPPPPPKPQRDSMHDEPEVSYDMTDAALEALKSGDVEKVEPPRHQWNQNPMPSNAEVDPETIYDRSSYEFNGEMNVTGAGVFDMEEGVAWRARDGLFAHDYALPNYIGREKELDVQQSQMWDTVAQNWRVVQPSGGGVTFSRRVKRLKPPLSGPMPEMRPDERGPSSHIEAFGRKAATVLVDEAKAHRPEDRSHFLKSAIETLGPDMTNRVKAVADRLVEMGYPAETALVDAVAHAVMHAAVADLTSQRSKPSLLPRLDRMAGRVQMGAQRLRAAAVKHVMPLTKNTEALQGDIGALYHSPAGMGIGTLGDDPSTSAARASLLTPKNIAIAGGVGLGAWLIWKNRKKLAATLTRLVK
jgi:hypothetical protein